MSRRHKAPTQPSTGPATLPHPRAGYDAVVAGGRRRAPRTASKAEDAELNTRERRRLTATARDLPRNFEVAAWALRMHLDYTASFGIEFTTPDDDLNTALEREIERWGMPGRFDLAGRHSLHRMVRLGESCALLDGDFWYLQLADGRVQGIEGDRIATPTSDWRDQTTLTHGIELDESGRARRLSVCRRDSSQLLHDRWVDARNAIQRAYFTRIDQVRGISPLAPAINRLQDLYEGYELALVKAKFANLLGMKLTREKLDAAPDFETIDADTGAAPTDTTDKYQIQFSQKAPFYLELEPGENLDFLESKIPSTEFAQFCEQMIRMALLALDIPYEFFDGSGVTYSLIRQKTMQYYQSARAKRKDVASVVSELVEWHLAREIARGRVQLPRGMTMDDLEYEIIFTGLPWLDPLKEVMANRKAVEADFTSEMRVCLEHGVDIHDVLREKAAVEKLRKRYGLAAKSSMGEPGQPPADPEETTS